jgi:hypothetical protein
MARTHHIGAITEYGAMGTREKFLLLHKLREAMAEEMHGRIVGGVGKRAEIDGGYF